MPPDDSDPFWREFISITFNQPTVSSLSALGVLIVLLLCSALISGSEVAFFSLSPSDKKMLNNKKEEPVFKRILYLLDRPEKLLATILIANNFINIGIVILSSFFFDTLINFNNLLTLEFVFKVVVITFLILLFGEILPKVFSTQYAMRVVKFMAYPLYFLEKLFSPFSRLLVLLTSSFQKKFKSSQKNISIKELSHALDLASDEIAEEKEMLESVVKFSIIEVQEIMCPRVNVVAIDIATSLKKLKKIVVESGFSRIPVYKDSLDNIKGIIHIKDLISHLHNSKNFKWTNLIRSPYFVPEYKKINDLLIEFKTNKNHIAIVVDEYGGTAGIITMEDILEEIVGEIYDESDVDEKPFEQLDDNTYSFIGKVQLNDFYKFLNISKNRFDSVKGDADSLAGLLLEIKGEMPVKDEKITFNEYTFIIESVDKKRIRKVKVIKEQNSNEG